MPPWIPRSVFGAIVAFLYVALAICAVSIDRKGGGGNWISLNGMASFLIVFPVSVVGEWLGVRPDYRRNLDMVFAIVVCAVLVYLLGAGLGKLARLASSRGGPG